MMRPVFGEAAGANVARSGLGLVLFSTLLLLLQLRFSQPWGFFRRSDVAKRWFVGFNVALLAAGVIALVLGVLSMEVG